MQNITPTKANLINAKVSLDFSKKGFELLDKKRNVLIKEIMGYMERVTIIEKEIGQIFKEAYGALQKARVIMGTLELKNVAKAIYNEQEFNIEKRSIMGVVVPHIECEKQCTVPRYSLLTTDETIDIAYLKFSELIYKIYELAEVENATFKLAAEVKKTQRKANSLENIQIPELKTVVKEITDILEEREREDFLG